MKVKRAYLKLENIYVLHRKGAYLQHIRKIDHYLTPFQMIHLILALESESKS